MLCTILRNAVNNILRVEDSCGNASIQGEFFPVVKHQCLGRADVASSGLWLLYKILVSSVPRHDGKRTCHRYRASSSFVTDVHHPCVSYRYRGQASRRYYCTLGNTSQTQPDPLLTSPTTEWYPAGGRNVSGIWCSLVTKALPAATSATMMHLSFTPSTLFPADKESAQTRTEKGQVSRTMISGNTLICPGSLEHICVACGLKYYCVNHPPGADERIGLQKARHRVVRRSSSHGDLHCNHFRGVEDGITKLK